MGRAKIARVPATAAAAVSAFLALLSLIPGATPALAQLPAGTSITNVATVEFIGSGGVSQTASSNPVEVVTAVSRTPATIELLRYTDRGGTLETIGPGACVVGAVGAGTIPLSDPLTYAGQPLDPLAAQPLISADTFHAGEAVFVRVADADQNVDPVSREFVDVELRSAATGDTETFRLIETDADSGVFVGYAPTAGPPGMASDCTLDGDRASSFQASYTDPVDASDRVFADGEFDPIGRVFDALTGAPVTDVSLTLIDAMTGQDAVIYGDDGVSLFPARLTTGGSVLDAGGTRYSFEPGQFRFPIIPPGEYELRVEPPEGYRAPSSRSEAELQLLAGAPFLLGAGSFGGRFTVGAVPIIAMDVPVDPAGGDLFLNLASTTTLAAPGDFLEYRLTLTHAGGLAPIGDTVIVNSLPPQIRYEPGTAFVRESGVPVEPVIGPDGRTLEFDVGTIDVGESVEITYVALVLPAGNANELTNRATAYGTDAESNEARFALALIDDLFTDTAFIVGRVAVGTCADLGMPLAEGEAEGFAGVRVYLEDGRFVVTDDGGRFHFDGIAPGVHVVQVDLESIGPEFEIRPCEAIDFARSGFSRFIELDPGQLKRADFMISRKPPPSGSLSLGMRQTATQETGYDEYVYALTVGSEDDIAAEDVQLIMQLPSGVRFTAASDGSGQPVPGEFSDGVLILDLGMRSGPWSEDVTVRAESDRSSDGELATQALLRFGFDGGRHSTPMVETTVQVTERVQVERNYVLNLNFDTLSAELRPEDRAELDAVLPDLRGISELRLEAVGHSDSVPISERSRAIYADNYSLSAARARSVADYLSTALALGDDQVTFSGVGPDVPIADNATAEGRRLNRRVELAVTGTQNAVDRSVDVVNPAGGRASIDVIASDAPLPPMAASHAPGPERLEAAKPGPDDIRLAGLAPGTEFLWPPDSHSPAIPNTKVLLKHGADDELELELNGEPVSPLNFEGTERQEGSTVTLSRWRGIDLADGANELVATVTRRDGTVTTLRQEVHFAGPPVRGVLLDEDSILVADGNSRPMLAVRLLDRWGQPAREGSTGFFEVAAPYRSWWEVERLKENPVVSTADRAPTYLVGPGGVALIELEPTTTTGQVEVTLTFQNQLDQELRAYIEPGQRDWILVGLAEGTLGFNSVSGNLEMSSADGLDEDYYDNGRLAFYAKGRVKGAMLTAAFDSDGDSRSRFDPFGGAIDPDRYYTIYADTTDQRYDAPTRDRLYVKLERGSFLAMLGDFETGLTVTELSRYSRSMTGFRSESHGDKVRFSAFAARADHSFVRDEIRGDGTSGPYRLSATNLLAGSDKLVLESRDRFRPDLIVATETLRRHFDYDIDYSNGTIYFREPVASRDFDFNPVYIVADYETELAGASTGVVAGGRAAVALGELDSEVGLTVIDDGTAGAEGQLIGADLRYWVNQDLEINAEIAETDTSALALGDASGSAYRIEVAHRTGMRQVEAYLRETDADFGLGQQRANESGTRRSGVTMRNELGERWLVEADAFRQDNLVDGGRRTVLETGSRYEDGIRTASLGLRRVDETIGDQVSKQNQTFVGGSWKFFDEVLTTRLNLENDFSSVGQSLDYPTRTIVGVDVAASDAVDVFGEHEIASGGIGDLSMTRFGVRANPVQGSEIDTSMQRTMTESGPRSFATLGMRQSFMVGERWQLDFGGERATMLDGDAGELLDERVPPASGEPQGDFSAAYLGMGFRAPAWSFTTRLERNSTDFEDKKGLISSFYREQIEGRGFSAELRLLDRLGATTGETFSGNLRLGWAYRPADSRWILFNRADWISETRTGVDTRNRNRRFVNNFNAHYQLGREQELALKYSLKSVGASFDGTEVTGTLDLLGIEWRRRLAPKYDFGIRASTYRAVNGDLRAHGFGVDVGIEIAHNFNLQVGYNFSGFDDADFSRAHYTAHGPFVQFRMKVDQASLRELLSSRF